MRLCQRIRRIRTLYAHLRANPTDSFYIFRYIVYKRTNPNGFIEFEPVIRVRIINQNRF
jgi:hypothetical protein